MPLYTYECVSCGGVDEQWQSMGGQHQTSDCPSCGAEARRVWEAPQAIADNRPAYFNEGLGCVVRSRSDVREAIKRINGTTGQRIVECDTPYKVKPKKVEYPTAAQMGIY